MQVSAEKNHGLMLFYTTIDPGHQARSFYLLDLA